MRCAHENHLMSADLQYSQKPCKTHPKQNKILSLSLGIVMTHKPVVAKDLTCRHMTIQPFCLIWYDIFRNQLDSPGLSH